LQAWVINKFPRVGGKKLFHKGVWMPQHC